MRSIRQFRRERVGAAAVFVMAAGVAHAGFTSVNVSGANGEQTLVQVLNHWYSAGNNDFASVAGTQVSASGVTATRIEDSGVLGHLFLNIGFVSGTNTDQTWEDGSVTVAARARYAAYSQRFGYLAGTGTGVPTADVAVTGSGYGATNVATQWSIGSGAFQWIRAGDGNQHYSIEANNQSSADHMVAFELSGASWTRPVYLLCWEDLESSGWDYDYNDLVMEVGVIPLPGSVALGFVGLALVGLNRRR